MNNTNLPNESLKRKFFHKLWEITNNTVIFFLLSIFSVQVQAGEFEMSVNDSKNTQQIRRNITGIVTDHQNKPLPGVTVQVVGRQGGVITDADGRYTIEAAPNEELRFQFVGMKQSLFLWEM